MKNIFLSIFLSRNGRGMFFLPPTWKISNSICCAGGWMEKAPTLPSSFSWVKTFHRKSLAKLIFKTFLSGKMITRRFVRCGCDPLERGNSFEDAGSLAHYFLEFLFPLQGLSVNFLSRACAFLAMFRVLVTSNVSRLMAQFSAARP